ncbi:FGGY-family carbohydrate kinase, partial [Liquorilactobacillus vini]|uniref:FGGY-family carbohydrate kinase n=1 Tax=Liquorilactobacillus vini TaxID=238015 RepID=UPI00228715E9
MNEFKVSSKSGISCISIASVGESGVLIDDDGNVISEMIAWYDNRSQGVINNLSNKDKESISRITGLPVSPHYSASKIRWLLNERVSDTKKYIWLCIPDFIAYKLTGKMRTEFSIASRTMLLDIKKRAWSEEIKKIFKIENVNLPPIIAAGEKVGNVKSYFINSLGISHNAYVTIAGHDHMVGSYSCDQSKNELLDSTGTTEGILLLTEKLRMKNLDHKNGISYGIYVRQNMYTAFTSLPSAGSII